MDSSVDNNFVWLDEYKIGHDTVDKQHQYLFELAKRIVNPDNDQQATHLNVEALYEYTHSHFRDEELLMEQSHYPDYEPHKKAHKKLIAQLNAVSGGILTDETPRAVVVKFMKDWLLIHILDEDMRFGDFLRTISKTEQDAVSSDDET